MNIGQSIKQLRMDRELSREDLAKNIGYGASIIRYWENNEKTPNALAVIALATFFNVTSDYILGLEDEFGNKIDQNDAPKVEEKKEPKLIEVPIAARSRGNKIPPKTYLMTEEQLDELVNRIRGTKD